MTIVTISRRFEFDAGHRVLGHKGKCRHVHGHRYVAEVTVHAGGLDELGMVIDFSVIKEVVGRWINDNWDHNIILHPRDPMLAFNILEGMYFNEAAFGDRHPYVMPLHRPNPTVENMVAELYEHASKLMADLADFLKVTHVRLYETPSCWADYSHKEA